MPTINILEPRVFNRIAAGEVVEKPASVVKELVENCIDAGSTNIVVEINNGGIDAIRVTDNGCGINKEDFPKVFLPHATSKIKNVEDLDSIASLGFRGEALASISSVANVSLISKVKTHDKAYKMTVDGGEMSEAYEWAGADGTTIEVKNLFFNIPARAKFLRKPKLEQADITNLMSRFILANPTIKITYITDGKTLLSSTGQGLKEAIYVVYGQNAVNNLIDVEYESEDGIKVSGFIGAPNFAKPNRTYQTLIINGRYVINNIVANAVLTCFEHYLMKGQFPFYVLNLNMDLGKLDVNVHPNKMDVKFENSNHIYGIILQAITKALANINKINQVEASTITYKTVTSGVSFNNSVESLKDSQDLKIVQESANTTENLEENKPLLEESLIDLNSQTTLKQMSQPLAQKENKSNVKTSNDFYNSISTKEILKDSADLFRVPGLLSKVEEDIKLAEEKLLQEKQQKANESKVVQSSMDINKAVRFVGEIFNTYLIVEVEGNCFIIDLHAAHERLLYDKLLNEVNSKKVSQQLLLIPHSLDVNVMEFEFIEENLDKLQSLGFDISVFGKNCFRISAIPSVLTGLNINNFFKDILQDLTVFKNYKQSDLLQEKLMQKSCKAAVKAGKQMSENEVLKLLECMKQEKMVLSCPHGRPVMVELTQKELEKWFKRIV